MPIEITSEAKLESYSWDGTMNNLPYQSILRVQGIVRSRPAGMINPDMKTGYVEVVAQKIVVLNICGRLPFPAHKKQQIKEEVRLAHRYLELRGLDLQRKLRLRSKIAHSIRCFLIDNEFVEIETPMLFRPTPEGAREFIVPTRMKSKDGSPLFYALPQSPQQCKQILMAAGFEKYFQITKCFRDETNSSTRQPEFTQIDIEMAFIEAEDLYSLCERLIAQIWKEALNINISPPFPRMTYREAMDRYGSDKPDTRFQMFIQDVTHIFTKSNVEIFNCIIDQGGFVKAINAKGLGHVRNKEIDAIQQIARSAGAPGVVTIAVSESSWNSPINKALSETERSTLAAKLDARPGDLLILSANTSWDRCSTILGLLRLHCIKELQKRNLLPGLVDVFNFLWIVDFPLFSENEGILESTHHPFTAPLSEDIPILANCSSKSELLQIRGQHYDLVVNGVELGGGSIRMHTEQLQRKVLQDVLRISNIEIFSHLLEVLRTGCPPHGGIAFGFDRMMSILTGSKSIRDVIAFPKAQSGDLFLKAPAAINEYELKEYNICPLSNRNSE